MKSYTLSKNSNFVPAMSITTRSPPKRKLDPVSGTKKMSDETRDFIQKICYRQSASIDMTQYGFITDTKFHLVNLMLKPLRAKLEKILCGSPHSTKQSISPKKSRSPSRTSPNRQYAPKRAISLRRSLLSPKLTSGRSRSPKKLVSPRRFGSPRYSPDSILRDIRPSISNEKNTLAMETSLGKRKMIMKTIKFEIPTAPTNSKIRIRNVVGGR